jgi:putative tryptophan/tyrosine transport system substrate-binding protein
MRRRELIAAVAANPVLSAASSRFAELRAASAIIGLLSPFSRAETEPWHQAFRQGLRDLGWTEGANARLEYRYADGRSERLPALAAELVALKPDILVVSVTPDAHAALEATKTIPIVMASPGDPVATGLVASLARPGGNVTGLTQISTDLAAKRLQLLKEIAPGISRVAVLWNPPDRISALTWREIQSPAEQLGLTLHSLEVQGADQFDVVFVEATAAHNHALIALPTPLFVVNAKRVADFALVNRLPSVFHLPEFVQAGGLLSYGPDRADLFRRAAAFVDKILKGAKPADLPVEQPTKFELTLNLKTAKALGLAIPPGFVARADEVIE